MIDFFKKFLPYIKGHYFLFLIAILAGIVAAVCTAWVTYLVKPVLDGIFVQKDPQMLAITPILLVLAYCGKAIGTFFQTFLMGYIGEDIIRQIRNRMLGVMLRLDLSFFNQNRNGELLARITNDIGIIKSAVSTLITDFVREGVTAIALIGVVIYQSPKLALFGLLAIPLMGLPTAIVVKYLKRYSKRSQEKNADITSRLTEILNNVEVIKTSNGEMLEAERFEAENNRFFKINIKAFFMHNLNGPIMEFLGAFAVGVVIFVGGRSVISGELSVGEFSSFVTALFMAYTPIKRLVNAIVGMQASLVASDRIYEVLDEVPQIQNGTTKLKAPIQSIAFKNVSFGYTQEDILHHISLEVQKNQIIAFVGKSGSGKSTLISLLLRLYEARSGEILINQTPIQEFDITSLRDQFALVNQRMFIFNDSIASNVAYGKAMDRERVVWALKKALIWDFVESLPQGIDTLLDEFGANLSGGQRQRIAIARALYRDPQVLILDEATSALDSKTEEAFKEIIASISQDKIVLVIAHRPSTIELAHQVYHLKEGMLI